ncbi:S8 family peptidase [Paraburkholderia hospita]|uniref:S8 family peptidase n=1 Tax=Paraburkholderia hospita TaxID=169430 RepID=UPI000B347BA5|nr:S8 family serine peptidase [Paraburkholderia hospita]OUL83400.1 hypothetical protein CA603_26195 [Paraburkholderia hospita]
MESSEKNQYVVISEAFADLLKGDTAAKPKPTGTPTFSFSSAGTKKISANKVAAREAAPGQVAEVEHAKAEPTMAKVIQLSPQDMQREKREKNLSGRIFPALYYFPQVIPLPGSEVAGSAKLFAPSKVTAIAQKGATPTAVNGRVQVKVVDVRTRKPLEGVEIFGFRSASRKVRYTTKTNAAGQAVLDFEGVKLAEVWAFPPHSHWSSIQKKVAHGTTVLFELSTWDAVGNRALDLLRTGAASDKARGQGVRVAVIDTGVAKHKGLRITKRMSIVDGKEKRTDNIDVQPHGTHVAGIIAGALTEHVGPLGIAPKAQIYSYRIFAGFNSGAVSSDLALAIIRATNDGCHIINLSLSGGAEDDLVTRALKFAEDRGVLVIAAAGNQSADAVAFPASEKTVVSVGAMGCSTTYPKDSFHALNAVKPWGATKSHYIARFSNSGFNLICSSVGVAVISTVPGDKYQAMDGTSMACPAVTAIAACLLSMDKYAAVLGMPANKARSVAMRKLLYTACSSLGFDPAREGKKGLPS